LVVVVAQLGHLLVLGEAAGAKHANARLALVLRSAAGSVGLVSPANAVGAVIAEAILVLEADGAGESAFEVADAVDALLGVGLAGLRCAAAHADIGGVIAYVGEAHVVVLEALLAIGEFVLARVVVEGAVLAVDVAVGSALAPVQEVLGLLGDALVAEIVLLDVAGAAIRAALEAVVAGDAVVVLVEALVVGVEVLVVHVLAELGLLVAADVLDLVAHLADGALVLIVALGARTGVEALVFAALLVDGDEAAVLAAVGDRLAVDPEEVHLAALVLLAVLAVQVLGLGDT